MPSLKKKRKKGEPLGSGFSFLEEGVWGLLIAAILRGTRGPIRLARGFCNSVVQCGARATDPNGIIRRYERVRPDCAGCRLTQPCEPESEPRAAGRAGRACRYDTPIFWSA